MSNPIGRIFRVALPTSDVDAFLRACEASEWYAWDSGERVMTDEGPDAEAILFVEPTPQASPPARTALVH